MSCFISGLPKDPERGAGLVSVVFNTKLPWFVLELLKTGRCFVPSITDLFFLPLFSFTLASAAAMHPGYRRPQHSPQAEMKSLEQYVPSLPGLFVSFDVTCGMRITKENNQSICR